MKTVENKNTTTEYRSVADIEQAFKGASFTNTAGYRHYVSDDQELLSQRDESIGRFLSDESKVEPEMMFGRHSWEAVNQAITTYDELLADLMSRQNRTPEEDDLADRIINKAGELFRYEELMLALGGVAADDVYEHRRLASDLSLEIMGYVDQVPFDGLVDEMLGDASKSSLPYVRDLLDLVDGRPNVGESSFASFELEESTMEIIKQDLFSLYPGLSELLAEGPEGKVSPEDAVSIFNKLIQIGRLEEGWQTKLDDGKSARTAGREKAVYIGRDREPFESHTDAVAVGFHEAIVHASRSQGKMLAGSLDFEEGIATRFQQIISGKKRTPGKQYYLSIGLQAGADNGGEHRNYRQVFEILWRREAMLMEQAGKEVDMQKARSNAQRQVHRTRRGGAIDTRDSSYFVGAQKAAVWLNEVAQLQPNERQEKLRWILSGSFDPTNLAHVAIMEKGA